MEVTRLHLLYMAICICLFNLVYFLENFLEKSCKRRVWTNFCEMLETSGVKDIPKENSWTEKWQAALGLLIPTGSEEKNWRQKARREIENQVRKQQNLFSVLIWKMESTCFIADGGQGWGAPFALQMEWLCMSDHSIYYRENALCRFAFLADNWT